MCRRIPLWVKLIYSAFAAVLVWVYWRSYGPQNFLNFCDIAVLVTLVGIWTESRLLLSMQAVAVVLPQLLWLLDFAAHLIGFRGLQMTDYMFDSHLSLFLRSLSLFHGWMPFLLIWLVHRVGYDRRGFPLQCVVGTIVLIICYSCFAPPGTHVAGKFAANLNLVFGLSATTQQTTMPPLVWLGMLIVAIPMVMVLPMHLVLKVAAPASSSQT